jgi:hypothetical protein
MAKLLIATRMFENVAVDAWGNSLTGASAEWVSKGIFEYVVNDLRDHRYQFGLKVFNRYADFIFSSAIILKY